MAKDPINCLGMDVEQSKIMPRRKNEGEREKPCEKIQFGPRKRFPGLSDMEDSLGFMKALSSSFFSFFSFPFKVFLPFFHDFHGS